MSDVGTDIGMRLNAYRAGFELSAKTALVLGAASGIGRAPAEALSSMRPTPTTSPGR